MKDPAKIDLKHMVIEYRKSRMGLIQTPEQLRFAWKAVIDALDNEKWVNIVICDKFVCSFQIFLYLEEFIDKYMLRRRSQLRSR